MRYRAQTRRSLLVGFAAAMAAFLVLDLGYGGAEQPAAGTIYARLREGIENARASNVRNDGRLPHPPMIRRSLSAPEGLTNGYLVGTAKQDVFTVYGGEAKLSDGSYWRLENTTRPDGRRSQTGFRIGAWVDSERFALKLKGSPQPFRLIVDDHFITPKGIAAQSGSTEDYVEFDFRKAGGRARRHVVIEWQGEAQEFGGVLVAPSETLTRESRAFLRGVFYGDSYMASGADGLPENMCDFMSVADCWAIAIGGTGFLNPGSDWPYIAHVRDLTGLAIPPDFIVVGSAANDRRYGPARIEPAVLAFAAAVRAAPRLGKTPTFFIGAWSNNSGPDSEHIEADRAVGAAVAKMNARGDANVFYIPSAADPNGPDISGTGDQTAPNGSGNADRFGVPGGHLNSQGWTYLARRLVDKIEGAIAAKP